MKFPIHYVAGRNFWSSVSDVSVREKVFTIKQNKNNNKHHCKYTHAQTYSSSPPVGSLVAHASTLKINYFTFFFVVFFLPHDNLADIVAAPSRRRAVFLVVSC